MIKGYVIQISSNRLSKESAEKTIESGDIGKIDVILKVYTKKIQ